MQKLTLIKLDYSISRGKKGGIKFKTRKNLEHFLQEVKLQHYVEKDLELFSSKLAFFTSNSVFLSEDSPISESEITNDLNNSLIKRHREHLNN